MKRLLTLFILLTGFVLTVIQLRIYIKSIETSIQSGNQQDTTINNILPIHTIGAIPDPSEVAEMTVKVTGMSDNSLVISDAAQKTIISPKTSIVKYHITAKTYNYNHSLKLPVRDSQVAEYLKPGKFICVSGTTIESKARTIIGDEVSADIAAYKLWDWVNRNMTYDINTKTDRDAVRILKCLKGRCEHYAILYVALARSIGIPSRVVAGLSYSDRSYGYHVWAESYVGEWIPVDPVDKPSFVDATHIKRCVVEEQLARNANTIDNGMLSVEIIAWKYRFNILPGVLAVVDANYLHHKQNGKLMMYSAGDNHNVVNLSGRSDGAGLLYKVSQMQDALLPIGSLRITRAELDQYPFIFAEGSFAVRLPSGKIAIFPRGSQYTSRLH